jgi:cell division protein FtsQ
MQKIEKNKRRRITADERYVMKQKIIKSTTGKILCRKYFIVFIMTALAILISFWFIRFCRVNTISIHNNSAVSTEQILEAANIKSNKHIFAVNVKKIEAAVLETSPYIKSVQVKRNLPSEIVIEVEEHKAAYCVFILNRYYLVSDNLLVLEPISEAEMITHSSALLTLPEINTDNTKKEIFGIGKKLVFVEQEDNDFVEEILKTISESTLSGSLTSLALHEEANITAIVNDRYMLRLGNKKELAKKIDMCVESMEYLQTNMPSVTGTLFAWSTKQVTFEITGAN